MTSLTSLRVATELLVDGNNVGRRAAWVAQAHDAWLHILHTLGVSGGKPFRHGFAPTIDVGPEAAHARGTPRRMADLLLGSLSGSLLSETACDMLVVPEPRSDPQLRAQATPAHWIHHAARFMPRRPS